jgi:hypothetical protein
MTDFAVHMPPNTNLVTRKLAEWIAREAYCPMEGVKSFGRNIGAGLIRCVGGTIAVASDSRMAEHNERTTVVSALRNQGTLSDLHGRAVVVNEGISLGADLTGIGVGVARGALVTMQAVHVAQILGHVVQPALGAASGAAFGIACAFALGKLVPLRNLASEGLGKLESEYRRAEENWYAIVGPKGDDAARASALKTLSKVLSRSEAEILMVIADRHDQAINRRDAQAQQETLAIGLALVQEACKKRIRSRVLLLLVNLAIVAVSIALIFNPFTGPLALAALLLSILSIALTVGRSIQDRSLCLKWLDWNTSPPRRDQPIAPGQAPGQAAQVA